MKQAWVQVVEHETTGANIWRLVLEGAALQMERPGQFLQVAVRGHYLRRPLSVAQYRPNRVVLWYKVVGAGTEALSRYRPGEYLDVLAPLGNGFSTERPSRRPLLVGGGMGTPPLMGLAEALVAQGKMVQVVLGFARREEVFGLEAFRALGVEPHITTADGSQGRRGLVTEGLEALSFDAMYACGPMPMLRALSQWPTPGQFSLEARMACGFGACMGCSCQTREGAKRICKEGPVFDKEVLTWSTFA